MRTIILFLLVWLVPHAAIAASEPVIAPIPEWAEQLDLPDANPALRDRHLQTLLLSNQTLFGAEQNDHFVEMAFLVQTLQGLQSIGNIVLPWQPDHSDLFVHKVHIVRGGTVVDLLAIGHEFTVLRRENNLESAMLDGTLTAVMQAEGLEVGDVLDIAFTIRRRGSTLPLRGESFFALVYGNPVGRFHVRQIWPSDMSMQWAGRGQLERARVRTTRRGTELVVDLANVEGPQPPEQAPTRFAAPATLQITEFGDWAEISRLVAPHYDRASTLAPASPLHAHIERIANASPDLHTRAMAALRLVQDDIRYFALTMGDGNYLPATADQTWTRRYGDCKGKTVTLIALLHGLGIEAEPVLVNSTFGDALQDRLPQMGMFDHVIVRARIDGQSYWMDGTRSGDRDIEDLASSTFLRGLPLRESGAELEAIPFVPPRLALAEQNIVYDASAGFDDPVPITMEMVFRGDVATGMRMAMAQVGREEFIRLMREERAELPGEEEEVTSVDVREDSETGTFTIVLTGTARMTWRRTPGAATHRFRFSNGTIDWNADFDRPAGPLQDAPFALAAPVHLAATETVILPRQGRGYTIEGESFERTVAGTRISRTLRLEGGRAIAHSTFRRLEREISASEARNSVEALRQITDDTADLIAPPGSGIRVTGIEDDNGASPRNAGELVESGYRKMGEGRLEEALADFDRALELAPDFGRAHANRGVALIHLDRLDQAVSALADAMRRDPADFVVHQGYGLLHLAQGHPEDAIRSFSRALELDAGNTFTLSRRADAYLAVERFDEALTDADAILAREPGHVGALSTKARIYAHRNEAEAAATALDDLMASNSTDPERLAFQAQTLKRIGRPEAAAVAYARAIEAVEAAIVDDAEENERLESIQRRSALYAESGDSERAIALLTEALADHPDHSWLLNERCWIRAIAGIQLEEALADCDRAIAAEPGSAAILDSRAMVKLRLGRIDDAVTDATAALAESPMLAQSLYVRGIARLRNGDREGGSADLAAARQLMFDIDREYREYGVQP